MAASSSEESCEEDGSDYGTGSSAGFVTSDKSDDDDVDVYMGGQGSFSDGNLSVEHELALALTGDTNNFARTERRVLNLAACGFDTAEGRVRMSDFFAAARTSAWLFDATELTNDVCVACELPRHCRFEIWEQGLPVGNIGRACKEKFDALESWYAAFRKSAGVVKGEMLKMRNALNVLEFAHSAASKG